MGQNGDQLTGQRDFPLLGRISLCPKAAAEYPFIPRTCILRVTLSVITRGPFPVKPITPHQEGMRKARYTPRLQSVCLPLSTVIGLGSNNDRVDGDT